MTNAVLDPAIAVLKGELAAMQARITMLERNQRSAYNVANTSIENGALTVNDANGNPALVVGLQADGSYGVAGVSQTITPADVPDAPLVYPGFSSLTAVWDGLMSGGTPSADFASCQVHCSTDPNFIPSPATLQGQLIGGAQLTIAGLTPGTTYYLALVSVNVHGILGAPSAVVSAVPVSVQSVTQQFNGAAVTFSASPPSNPNPGDLWYNTAQNNQLSQFTGGAWQLYQFGTAAISAGAITAGQIAAGTVFAGIVDGTTVQAAQFIGGVSLYYSGSSPALGTLVGSNGVVSGFTDSVGNHVFAGTCSYKPHAGSGTADLVTQMLQGTYNTWSPSNIGSGSPASVGNNISLFTGTLDLQSGTASSSDNEAEMSMRSQNTSQGGSGIPYVALEGTMLGLTPPVLGTTSLPTTSGPWLWCDNNLGLHYYSSSNMDGIIPFGRAVQGGNTNNTTSMNAMFAPFPIPASDAVNQVVYRITCGGHGTQASGTAVSLNFLLVTFGQNWGSSTDNLNVPAGGNFHWRFQGDLIVNANGAGSFFGQFVVSQTIASAPGRVVAMDTQVAVGTLLVSSAWNITLQAGWASITGAPTLVCTGAAFERLYN